MKSPYPREYEKKALDVIEKNYFNNVRKKCDGVELIALAAHCINVVAKSVKADGLPVSFELIKEMVAEPQPYSKNKKKS